MQNNSTVSLDFAKLEAIIREHYGRLGKNATSIAFDHPIDPSIFSLKVNLETPTSHHVYELNHLEINDLFISVIKKVPSQNKKKSYSFLDADMNKIKDVLSKEILLMPDRDQKILIEIYRLCPNSMCSSWKPWKGKGSYDATVRSITDELISIHNTNNDGYDWHSRHRQLINELRDNLYKRGLIKLN